MSAIEAAARFPKVQDKDIDTCCLGVSAIEAAAVAADLAGS